MFERIQSLSAPTADGAGLELVFQSGLKPDPAFVARVNDHFRQYAEFSGARVDCTEGLAEELEQSHAALMLMHGSPESWAGTALFIAAFASALVRRLGGGEPGFEFTAVDDRARIKFDCAEHFVHSFALLYSVSFLHYFWRERMVEPRLNQLLEVAEVFFLNNGHADGLDGMLGLEQQFPQETLNSFVNMVHPNPQTASNMLTKILLLEDNRELGEIIADMLSSYSYVVCQAPDGISGLSRLERERFHLILSDIQMPRLNGMGLLKVVRNLHMDVPVILTTGFTGIWQEDQALKQGAVAFLPKPFGMADLIRTVEQALAGSTAAHSRN